MELVADQCGWTAFYALAIRTALMNVHIKIGALRTAAHTAITWLSLAVQVPCIHMSMSAMRSDGSVHIGKLCNR